jgi:hypothetical protein
VNQSQERPAKQNLPSEQSPKNQTSDRAPLRPLRVSFFCLSQL